MATNTDKSEPLPEWLEPGTIDEIGELWKNYQEKQAQYVKNKNKTGQETVKNLIDEAQLKIMISSLHSGRDSHIPEAVIKKLKLKYPRGLEGFTCDVIRNLAVRAEDKPFENLGDKKMYKILMTAPERS